MKKTFTEKERGTAYHEAGHAVALLVQGLHVEQVSIRAEDDYNGSCVQPSLLMYNVTSKRERKALARRCIISSYAGIEAERLIDPDAPEWHGQWDFQNAFEISREYVVLPRACAHVGDDLHDAFLLRLRREARGLVGRHRPLIDRLATALLRARTLTGDQARAVLEGTDTC